MKCEKCGNEFPKFIKQCPHCASKDNAKDKKRKPFATGTAKRKKRKLLAAGTTKSKMGKLFTTDTAKGKKGKSKVAQKSAGGAKMTAGRAGIRTCVSCGQQWRSTHGMLMDAGLVNPFVQTITTANPADLMGLTCASCGNSYCKTCLGGKFLLGGSCPSCGGKLNVA